jgi:putative addiction module killer protein
MFEIAHCLTRNGRDLCQECLEGLRDRSVEARITVRVARLAAGAFGDCKPVGEGVWELRAHVGPGYRICHVRAGERLILLLSGGHKDSQRRDIEDARTCWRDYQERSE